MNKQARVTEDGVRQGSASGASEDRESAVATPTHKIITYRTDLILNGQSVLGWKAYIAGSPATWECGATEAEAIGQLMITYARAWPERWPGLELESPRTPAEAEEAGRTEYERVTRTPDQR